MKQTFLKLLNDHGFRVTQSRLALLEILSAIYEPVDVVQIANIYAHKKRAINQVTIYRILEAFIKKGIVKRLDFHEGKFRYELVKTDHHHLICQKCGTVADIINCPINDLEKDILHQQNFLVKQHALEFFGLCVQCQ